MSTLQNIFDSFHDAILRCDTTNAVGSVRHNQRIPPERQLAIYIDGYRIRLIQAIRSDYPELLALLGDKVFDRLALQYIEAKPPSGYNLDRYPHSFADFVRPQVNAFAADLATLEGAIAEVFMMDDSNPLDASLLSGVAPETFGGFVLLPRAASRLLALQYMAEGYMAEIRAGEKPAIPAVQPEYIYLVRHHNEVKRHILQPAEYFLLQEICEGKPINIALDEVIQKHPQFLSDISGNLTHWFARWTGNGFFMEAAL